MSDLLKERVLLVLALLLCAAVSLLAVFDAPEVSPIGVVYSESAGANFSGTGTSMAAQVGAATAVVSAGTARSDVSQTANASTSATRASSAPKTAASVSSRTGKININTASKDVLMQLDGIGETLAQRIIDYRTQHNGFDSIEELKQVKGIGDKRFEAIRDDITVG